MIERLLRLTARNACSPIERARLVAGPGRLDLDHVGAHVGQHLPAERPGHHLAELDHAQAVERAAHAASRSSAAPTPSPTSWPASLQAHLHAAQRAREHQVVEVAEVADPEDLVLRACPGPAPSDMSKRSRITRRTSSEPSSSTAVSEPENSRSSSASTSRPQPATAARVAAAWRAWRAKTFSRPFLAQQDLQRLAQPVEQVGGARVRPVAGLVGGDDRRPVPVRARQPARSWTPRAPSPRPR